VIFCATQSQRIANDERLCYAITSSPPRCFFQLHGFIECEDCALHFAVVGRLSRDPLQPQPRSGHKGKQRAAMLSGKANNLVRDAAISGSKAMRIPKRAQNVCTGIAIYTNMEIIITVIKKLVPQRGW